MLRDNETFISKTFFIVVIVFDCYLATTNHIALYTSMKASIYLHVFSQYDTVLYAYLKITHLL